LLGS
jgi:integrase/recombinase XerD